MRETGVMAETDTAWLRFLYHSISGCQPEDGAERKGKEGKSNGAFTADTWDFGGSRDPDF